MEKLEKFESHQIDVLNNSVAMAEELVCNYYKMSANQWLRHRYDVKTLNDLADSEIVHGPFAQIIRYVGQRKDGTLGSTAYDFYKICLQDHTILSTLNQTLGLSLFPFIIYIMTHELIHIIRFSKYVVNFEASPEEKVKEETVVHEKTHEILRAINESGIEDVLEFFKRWRLPID